MSGAGASKGTRARERGGRTAHAPSRSARGTRSRGFHRSGGAQQQRVLVFLRLRPSRRARFPGVSGLASECSSTCTGTFSSLSLSPPTPTRALPLSSRFSSLRNAIPSLPSEHATRQRKTVPRERGPHSPRAAAFSCSFSRAASCLAASSSSAWAFCPMTTSTPTPVKPQIWKPSEIQSQVSSAES